MSQNILIIIYFVRKIFIYLEKIKSLYINSFLLRQKNESKVILSKTGITYKFTFYSTFLLKSFNPKLKIESLILFLN